MVAKADISVHARAPSGTGHYLLCEDPVLGVSTQSITEVTCPKCLAVLAEYADDRKHMHKDSFLGDGITCTTFS
jgi:hypothetical protein